MNKKNQLLVIDEPIEFEGEATHILKTEVPSLAKPPSWIGVENRRFQAIKEGLTSKPNSSKLGTCQGQHSFTLAYQTPFQNWHFWTCVASAWEITSSNSRLQKKITNPFKRIYWLFFNSIHENWKMSTCNWLVLETQDPGWPCPEISLDVHYLSLSHTHTRLKAQLPRLPPWENSGPPLACTMLVTPIRIISSTI